MRKKGGKSSLRPAGEAKGRPLAPSARRSALLPTISVLAALGLPACNPMDDASDVARKVGRFIDNLVDPPAAAGEMRAVSPTPMASTSASTSSAATKGSE